jgi:hypothetical protein
VCARSRYEICIVTSVTADKRGISNIGQVECVPMQSEIGEREVTPKRVRAVRDAIEHESSEGSDQTEQVKLETQEKLTKLLSEINSQSG